MDQNEIVSLLIQQFSDLRGNQADDDTNLGEMHHEINDLFVTRQNTFH